MLLFGTANLFTGVLADMISRKWMLCLAGIAWSFTSIGTGLSNKFWELCIMRVLLGLLEACLVPTVYSLISDFFPPEKRTLANSIYSMGMFIGTALENLTVIIINAIGWRGAYFIVGGFGIVVGLIGIAVIKEPGRGVFAPPIAA